MEATLQALIDKIGANLAAKLTAINAEHADAYTLEVPFEVAIAPAGELAGYPYVVVGPVSTEVDRQTDTGGRIIWLHRVEVVAILADNDAEALRRRLLRYQRALREVVMDGRDPGTAAGGFGLTHERDDYGPLFRPDPDGIELQSMAASTFRVLQQQTL